MGKKNYLGDFVHLHTHSHYSLLDGLCSPEELVVGAREKEFKAIAITDHGSISGTISLCKAAKEHGIKPIVGIEAYFCDDVTQTKGQKNYHILILAKSELGLKSIYKLMTKAHDHFYYKPRIDMEMLYDLEDAVVSTACLGGILKHPNCERIVRRLQDYFEDDFYLEIMPVDLEEQWEVNRRAIEFSAKYDIKLLATNDIHYLQEGQEKLHNFLLKINTGGKMEFNVSGLYMRSREEMIGAFAGMGEVIDAALVREALTNTVEVAEKCNVDIPERDIILPQVTKGDPREGLGKILRDRVKTRYPNGFKYQDRLDYEVSVLAEKNFIPYFLMVDDFVQMAKKEGMTLGCGRGSAAGSLICYILGITDIDPIEEDLLFERFLNPERTDYPDIDLDFPRSRRHEIIEYAKKKYGEERVSYISTVSRLKTKSAFKDVAKALGVSFSLANRLSESIDEEKTFAKIVEENSVFKEQLTPEVLSDLVYYTDGISGTLRHASKHAAGIVIAPSAISDFGILEKSKDERCINWGMNDVSHQGLVKVDFLGLRTLDVMDEALKLIKKRHGVEIDWRDVGLSAPRALDIFGDGHTTGIFQFEQAGTRRLVKRLNPITDKNILIDCNALVRPGPLDSGMTEKYIGRHTGKDVVYDEPYVDWFIEHEIGAKTYRVIIYQEQVIEVLQRLAGYTTAQADVIRRIFAKKKGDMEGHRKAFLKGCKKTAQMPNGVASILFDHLETFSRYGFNKSHAAAYTELGLRQMYLKIHYPLEYMTALFKWTDEEDKKLKFADECRRLGIEVVNPDINQSDRSFTIDGDKIRIGLLAIKGVGVKSLEHIEKQKKFRLFKSVEDFRLRIQKAQVDKRVWKNLILTGCFDGMDVNQKAWIDGIDSMGDKDELPEIIEGFDDYTDEEKEVNKASLIPGVYRMKIEPKFGLRIDLEDLGVIKEFVADCRMCSLREAYDCPVGFDFTGKSELMIVAEAPAEEELRQGKPLCPPGKRSRLNSNAGSVLRDLLREIGIEREDCYLTNVYKCRAMNSKLPANPPKDCWKILEEEIKVVQPKLILALGNPAREFFTGQKTGIQQAAESLRCEAEIVAGRPINLLFAVHPASVLYPDRGKENLQRLRDTMKVLKAIRKGSHEQ